MDLGNFSISLAVKDLAASRSFYQKLGFEVMAGDHKHYEILRNGTTNIGLFQGMFERNILTFNPGWDHLGENAEAHTDVRQLATSLRAGGLELQDDTTAKSDSGPASFMVVDPDGNSVLIDQHR
ncbi:MAG: VOC family protein [Nannocystaceae bacterium]